MIRVDIHKCTGCKRCESVCSFFHTGRINNHLSRIKVLNLFETGIDGPVVCIQCKERYCMCCPTGALTIGPFGQVVVSPTLCTLCGACEIACPIGALEMFNDFLYVCDLCGGRPKCVEVCTEGAITFEDRRKKPLSLAAFKKESKKLNSSQKRYSYIKKLGSEIRKRWRRANA